MHPIEYQRLQRPLHQRAIRHDGAELTTAGYAHDMLVMSQRPDLTPEFPAGLTHPIQQPRERTLPRP